MDAPNQPPAPRLHLLGNAATQYPDQYSPAVLEVFDNQFPDTPYEVELDCPEFTSLCPLTGQPDFAKIVIDYKPDQRCVESKSLKLYLGSFRMHGEFHESCINRICNDLVKLLDPTWITVRGEFTPRGGIPFWPMPRSSTHNFTSASPVFDAFHKTSNRMAER